MQQHALCFMNFLKHKKVHVHTWRAVKKHTHARAQDEKQRVKTPIITHTCTHTHPHMRPRSPIHIPTCNLTCVQAHPSTYPLTHIPLPPKQTHACAHTHAPGPCLEPPKAAALKQKHVSAHTHSRSYAIKHTWALPRATTGSSTRPPPRSVSVTR